MPIVFTLFRDQRMAASVARYFRHARGWTTRTLATPVVTDRSVAGVDGRLLWPPLTFRQLVYRLEEAAREAGGERTLREAAVLVEIGASHVDAEVPRLAELDPMSFDGERWTSVIAMLVLAFPEVHWCFYSSRELVGGTADDLRGRAHTFGGCSAASLLRLADILDAGISPLFDPTGLRDGIRQNILSAADVSGNPIVQGLPRRHALAVSVDDELPYAFFTAYTAYRFNFRAAVLSSYTAMRAMLMKNGMLAGQQPVLTFEDTFISAYDMSPTERLDTAAGRSDLLPRLDDAQVRVAVTIGTRGTPERALCINARTNPATNPMYKPLSGMFDLWTRSGVERWLIRSQSSGRGPGYARPPAMSARTKVVGGHSAPGRLLAIANCLLLRAEAIRKDLSTVADAVHGSCLALDAVEYLGHRTPTTSLEALSLQHRLEVVAECKFRGVEQAIDVQRRLEEIKQDVDSIGQWSHRQAGFAAHAKLGLVNDVMQTFRDHGRFDEEQSCLAEVRALNRSVSLKRDAWSSVAFVFRWYVEWLLGRMRRFVAVILLWVVVFAGLFAVVCKNGVNPVIPPAPPVAQGAPALVAASCSRVPMPLEWLTRIRIRHGLQDGLSAFLGLQPPHGDEMKWGPLLLTAVAMLFGFAHLGIFVSHLYTLIARR